MNTAVVKEYDYTNTALWSKQLYEYRICIERKHRKTRKGARETARRAQEARGMLIERAGGAHARRAQEARTLAARRRRAMGTNGYAIIDTNDASVAMMKQVICHVQCHVQEAHARVSHDLRP